MPKRVGALLSALPPWRGSGSLSAPKKQHKRFNSRARWGATYTLAMPFRLLDCAGCAVPGFPARHGAVKMRTGLMKIPARAVVSGGAGGAAPPRMRSRGRRVVELCPAAVLTCNRENYFFLRSRRGTAARSARAPKPAEHPPPLPPPDGCAGLSSVPGSVGSVLGSVGSVPGSVG